LRTVYTTTTDKFFNGASRRANLHHASHSPSPSRRKITPVDTRHKPGSNKVGNNKVDNSKSGLEPGHPASDYKCPKFRLHPTPAVAVLWRGKSARRGGFWFQLKLGSARNRQQLQVLRDAGLLLHIERGVWRLP
jgi:hypothetical protein